MVSRTRSPRIRKRSALTVPTLRSAITNGSAVLDGVDHRSAYMRRLRDLISAYQNDAGGEGVLGEGQKALIRRAAMLELQLEMLDKKFAEVEGSASARDLDLYGRTSGNLRRCLESLGLNRGRIPRDVTDDDPLTYTPQREAAE
jgi:hypothetical protein